MVLSGHGNTAENNGISEGERRSKLLTGLPATLILSNYENRIKCWIRNMKTVYLEK